jgi:hypothetical protein
MQIFYSKTQTDVAEKLHLLWTISQAQLEAHDEVVSRTASELRSQGRDDEAAEPRIDARGMLRHCRTQ